MMKIYNFGVIGAGSHLRFVSLQLNLECKNYPKNEFPITKTTLGRGII